MLDPEADLCRRVWIGCCGSEWRYLIAATRGPFVYTQCPDCHTTEWINTGFGDGRRPLFVEPKWPGEQRAESN